MVTITISRQYGSGGRKIAIRIAEILGYRFFDKRLMVEVARDVGLSENELVDYSEEDYTVKNFLDRFLDHSAIVGSMMMMQTHNISSQEHTLIQAFDETQAIDLVRTTVRAAHKRGQVVIVGRGGQAILQNHHDTFHVRIVAPINTRISRLVGLEGVRRADASRLIIERDKANREYAKRFFDITLDDPMLYHLVINTGRWNVEAASQLIVNNLKQIQQEQAKPAQASG